MKRLALPFSVLVVQCALLVIEVVTHYDTAVRQGALVLTNVLGTTVLVVVARQFARTGSRLPAAVSWLTVAGIWFDAVGNFAHFYARFFWWDKLAHGVGTAALTAGLWLVIHLYLARRRSVVPPVFVGLVTVGVATLLAVIYEITEYLGDVWFQTHRVSDLFDTPDDLLWNTVAAVIVVLILPRIFRRHD